MLPPLVIQGDQRVCRAGAVIEQGGGEPVGTAVAGAVVAGDGYGCFDDPDLDPAYQRDERAVRQMAQHRGTAGGRPPDQELGLGAGNFGQEPSGVEAAVHQYQHRLIQQVQQLARPVLLAGCGGAEDRAEQRPGAGLHERHELDDGVSGLAQGRLQLAQPGPVPVRVRDLDGLAPVECDRPVPAEHDPRGARLARRPGQHLEQQLQRRDADPAAQIPQCLPRRAGQAHPAQRRGQLAPHPRVSGIREQAHREQEVDPGPGRQQPQPPLPPAGLLQHRVHQLKRHDPGQLAQVPGREHARSHRDRPGNGSNSSTDGRLNAQRRSLQTVDLGRHPSYRTSVAMPAQNAKRQDNPNRLTAAQQP